MVRNPPSLKLRQQNGNSIPRRENKKEVQKKTEKQQSIKVNNEVNYLAYPAGDTALKALLSARFCAAIWSHVTDCDETYNYWEPTHYLIFGKGLQTWEYSPEYALRSYTYLMVYAAPAYLYQILLGPNPLLLFYLIRCVLGLLSALVELYFYKAVCREFGVNIGRMCLAFQLFSAGMFISSTALLPSSFAMYGLAGACAAWWTQKYALAIFVTALGSLLGWPFAALLGVPIAYDMIIMKKMYKDFIQWSVISAVAILLPMVLIDSSYYGKLVIAPWNIVKYNVFGGAGPDLYGTEPFSYYLLNGFLNFNFIWVLGLLCPVFLVLQYFFVPTKNKITLSLPHYVSIAPMFLWLAVFMFQAHKEERFLFPIYPMICLCGAISIDVIQKLVYRVLCIFFRAPSGTHYLDWTVFVMVGAVMVTSLMGVSRIFSLYNNYHAPLDLLIELQKYPAEGKIISNANVNVCLGKEWHRYPSSFFLPDKNWKLRFIQSEFKGILPAPYSEFENGTTLIHSHFNDKNLEEKSQYFDISKCHFLLDLDLGKETPLEPNYSVQDRWKVVKSLPFLNAEKSNSFLRAFYIPFITNKYVQYGNYNLLQTVRHRIKT
ncbi:PREDICTED: alpha-1,2-mannosyltransferase ALG9 [Nicrophorus vespilloides]|uniref:Mannosyltransferase n=1 Tax=Nicrophorus vespilloides TaxID=110193 RepID=A0ABM1M243_NICVS|nr:PREDICTED: alpha-1,2-mannosyltransferase ALG9 [Nicrophorus vespilloides]